MSSLNQVTLIGNVGKDPESRSFENGGRIVTFTMATSEKWTDRSSGEARERAEWHNVVVRNEKLCDIVEKYVRKGSKICVIGSIQGRKYTDRDGNERFVSEVVVSPFKGEIVLLGDKRESGQQAAAPTPKNDRINGNGVAWPSQAGKSNRRTVDEDLDDPIPF